MNEETEVITAESGTLALLNKSEIDMQIATAHKYPRSVVKFRTNVFNMVTLSEQIAAECIYAVPRDGKMIEGPSARFAEVVASAWGNSRAGARVVNDQGEFVTAQGVFHDLEQNVAITYEVQRRITTKAGKRFGADMIAVTANAACSIALRNAILKGVPKAFWSEMYDGARKTAMGDTKTLPTRRAEALDALLRFGVSPEQVYARLGVSGKEDMGLEQLATLRFILTAIKEGDTTPEQAFAADGANQPVKAPVSKSAKAAEEKPAQTTTPGHDFSKPSIQPQANPDTGELPATINAGQVKYLQQKIASIEVPESAVAAMMARVGAASFETLNLEQFDTIKAELLSMGA